MATPLRIPEQHRLTLENILSMDDKDVDELIAVLRKARPALSSSVLASRVATQLKRLEEGEVRRIVHTLLALYSVREAVAVSDVGFINNLWEGLKDATRPDFGNAEETDDRFSEQDEARFKERMTQFLNLETSVGMISKARSVLTEHDRTYCDARIMTDVRPVFGEDATEEPVAAVIVHTLRIGYHQDNEHREFFVGLDTLDVKALREVLERADQKAQQVKAMLERAKVDYLDVEEGES